MKRSIQYKSFAFLALFTVLGTYNQCVSSGGSSKLKYAKGKESSASTETESEKSTTYVTNSTNSVTAFQTSVYPLTVKNCISCHGNSQTPLHASANIQTAHDALVNSFKIDFNNPENSRMVLKLKNDKHNCWGDCSANAQEMLDKINIWRNKIAFSGTTNNTSKNTTEESETIKTVVDPNSMAGTGTITIMAEAMSLKAPMTLGSENNTSFVAVPEAGVGAKASNANDSGIATATFTVPETDIYKAFLYLSAPDGNSDSVFVKMGNDYKEFQTGTTVGYQWKEVKHTGNQIETFFSLTSGRTQTIELKQREDGIKISKIIITNDPLYDPQTNKGTNLSGKISLSLSQLVDDPNAKLEVNVEEYDLYSYKISNPKIIASKNLQVKGLKVLVNGSYNPQHSTYNTVNKTVTPTDGALSLFSMIVLKDKGLEEDRFSFSFDTIELVD